MKKLFCLLAILMSGVLFLTGCDSGDDDDDGTVVVTNAPAGPDANAQFAAITPSGLELASKFTVVGHGIIYTIRCNAITGAASYTFTTSFGDSAKVGEPTLAFEHAGADEQFDFSVYATNTNNFNTQTASATVN